MGIELKTKQGNITLTAPKVIGGGTVDLSNYYTKAQTDEQIKEAVDSIEIPEVDLSDYATEDWVKEQINAIPQPDMNDYAKIEDIPDVSEFIKDIPSEYVTDDELNSKGYLTEHQDLSDYATKSEIPSIEGLATKEYVDEAVTGVSGGDVDLSDYYNKEEIDSMLASLEPSLPISEEGEF